MKLAYVTFSHNKIAEINHEVYTLVEGIYSEEKYQDLNFNSLLNYTFIGKLGEEAVKSRLGAKITAIDYEVYEKYRGDGGVDFQLACDERIRLQIKTKSTSAKQWYISYKDLLFNEVFVFVDNGFRIKDAPQPLSIVGFITTDVLLEVIIEYFEDTGINRNNFRYWNDRIKLNPENICLHLQSFWILSETNYLMSINRKEISLSFNRTLEDFNKRLRQTQFVH